MTRKAQLMENTNPSPTIVGPALPNIPWEEKPKDCRDVVWRSSQNPIIPRDLIPSSNSIFNSAVIPFEGRFAGVFRVDNKKREMRVHSGKSKDGIDWEIAEESIEFITDVREFKPFEHQYDPRVCWIEDRYYVTWCNGYHGPTIGVGYTYDFEVFYQLENAFLPYNRNGYVYSMGAALLDIDQPWKVLYRSTSYLLSPQELYECVGDTPNVVFPCAALFDAPTGRIAIYYGGADTVTCLAYTQAHDLAEFVKANSEI